MSPFSKFSFPQYRRMLWLTVTVCGAVWPMSCWTRRRRGGRGLWPATWSSATVRPTTPARRVSAVLTATTVCAAVPTSGCVCRVSATAAPPPVTPRQGNVWWVAFWEIWRRVRTGPWKSWKALNLIGPNSRPWNLWILQSSLEKFWI